ncbi:RNA polymerase sigma-70 factor [Pedobacter sp. L105]|uniref:RNA polymerase sigma-70 factor n=1 Tax=Pedobacter sp. L105 TaxID=1641871 RepID=UPI00131D8613|nr:RNA polymerase sigma-70 factor [Pedobacter sp. L105]
MSIVKGIFSSKSSTEESQDQIGLDLLFKEFYDRLVYFSLQFVKDKYQAQDIVQDAFIKYWQLKDTVIPHKTAIKNFLYQTVRNASLNVIRHEKIVEGYIQLQGNIEPEEPCVIDAIIRTELMAEIHSAIQSLPESYRTISVMGYFDGKKNQEIADELNMSINTVKKQKQRALQLLRLKLTPETFMLLMVLTAGIYK